MRFHYFTVGVLITLSFVTFAKPLSRTMDQPWEEHQNPDRFGMKLGFFLGEVYQGAITNAEVKRMPWTGPWWPSAKGSAAIRIGQENDSSWGLGAFAFRNHHYSADELVEGSIRIASGPESAPGVEVFEGGLLDVVSPMEKFDIAMGNADPRGGRFYAHTRETLDFAMNQISNHPGTSQWNGLCNGFSAAAIYLPEPRAVKRLSKVYALSDGRKVQFSVKLYSGDLKGIATYQYAMQTWDGDSENIAGIVGASCDQLTGVGCRGINAGAFHILMTNLVGRSRESLIFDIEASSEIWNYPVVGYRVLQVALRPYREGNGSPTKWARAGAASEATHEVRIVMDVDYMGESDFGKFPWKERNRDKIFTRTYEYLVELTAGADGAMGNADDVVLGGEWLSADRPDIAWKLKRPYRFSDDYRIIDPETSDSAWSAAWQEKEWREYWSSLKSGR